MSNSVEEIYILDKDINVKEQYRNMFHEINENIKTDIQTTALEEFLNSIKWKKVLWQIFFIHS